MEHAKPSSNNARQAVTIGATLVATGAIPIVSATSATAATQLTTGQVAQLAKANCPQLSASEINVAVKVAGAESGRNPNAYHVNANGSVDRGIWQINSVHGALSTFDPAGNARAMCSVSSGGSNWNPWAVYASGAYRSQPGYTGSTPTTPAPSPKPHPVGPNYTVKSGDWLSGIARDQMGSASKWHELYAANAKTIGGDPNLIFPGQVLTIPNGDKPVTHAASPKGYVAPLSSPVITSPYNVGSSCWSRTCGGHSGIDLRAAYGTPVVAVSDASVVGGNAGSAYGTHVIIRNADGTYSLYGHLSRKTVAAGQRVKAGEVVGYSGTAGSGPHLHFEIRTDPTAFVSGIFINPVSWLRSHGVTI